MRDVSQYTDNLPENIARQVEAKRAGRRKIVRHGGMLCSRCLENPPTRNDRYCRACRNSYNADHRKAERQELKRLRALVAEQH